MIAPDPYLGACLDVLRRVTIYGRILAWSGQEKGLDAELSDCLGDMMNAVHNIPGLIAAWEPHREEWLRESLRRFDERWGHRPDVEQLLPRYLELVGN